jgi:hypothetical protein
MIFGVIVGGIIWSTCFSLFIVFPNALSFALAFFVGPFAAGYLGLRMGGRRAAYALTLVGTIMVLALSVTYLPHTSWEYPHHIWAGVGLFVTLLVLGSAIFTFFGSLTGIRAGEYSNLKQIQTKKKVVGQGKGDFLRGRAPNMTDPLQFKVAELSKRERDLRNDLAVIESKKGLEQISPELLQERQKVLQSQLLDIVLEKERLIPESKGKQ